MAKVFKFGGASVKDEEAVRNLAEIVQNHIGEPLLIVVSAMGKTTNALEKLLDAAIAGSTVFDSLFEDIKKYHFQIAHALFGYENHYIHNTLTALFATLKLHAQPMIPDKDFDRRYDQVVSHGELISAFIVSEWLKKEGLNCRLLDARDFIQTDFRYRSANVDWELTRNSISTLAENFSSNDIFLTQGFIGRAIDGSTTTLGREGSDYTAAIFAYCLDATEVTIWKDVPGLQNADPKRMKHTIKLEQISYSEAIELAFYGATIIHPKTIKPLQNKNIPLYVKSFLNPDLPPSVISGVNEDDSKVPSYIFKDNQMLVSIGSRDFSFMDEGRLQTIFGALHRAHIHTNLVQTSALSLSVCLDYREALPETLIQLFGNAFYLKYNHGLSLLTIRHYDESRLQQLTQGRKILLEQRSRTTLQFVMTNE